MIKNNIKSVLVTLGIISFLLFIIFYAFLNIYLPYKTNKTHIVTVPELKGLTLDKATILLKERNLNFEILNDSGYNANLPILTVVEQYPKATSRVKIERIIQVRLNSKIAPFVTYPDLTGASIELATEQLSNLNLIIDSLFYIPDIAVNTIIESQYRGKRIEPGSQIRKGSYINLFIGSSSDSATVKINL